MPLSFLKSAPAAHTIPLQLTHDHGYVLAVLVATVLTFNGWMAVKVGQARKRYGVAYPTLYSGNDAFDAIQRGHQNTICEAAPAHYALLLVAGLIRPREAAVAGTVFLLGRILYFLGYSTGEPRNRMRGAFGNFGTLGLLVIIAKAACALLRG